MVTLSNGLYRILVLTCGVCCKANVRNIVRVGVRAKSCSSGCVDVRLTGQFGGSQRWRQNGGSNKRFRVKIPPLSADDFEKSRPMSDSVQPTTTHVSYGGHFDISTEGESEDWLQFNESGFASGADTTTATGTIPHDFRVWEPVNKKTDSINGSGFKFKVLSYNVLAQYLLECHPYLYTDCAPRDLKWKKRAARLYQEITRLAPDILCFQEVQATHLKTFYAEFEKIGYTGIFKQKTGHRQDGCAIYFKTSIFELQDQVSVEFYQPELPILNRDNIGIMVKLTPRSSPSSSIVVATTHLLYNPKRTDVRLAQIQVFLAEIDRFAYQSKESGHLPIILTGDFNSTPESAVIQLLDNGQVSASPFRPDSSDWQRIGVTDNCQHLAVYLNRQQGKSTDFSNVKIYNSDYNDSEPGADSSLPMPRTEFSDMFNSGVIGHSLSLTSVYNKYKTDGDEEASTFQDYWVTVDYIYFSCCSSLRLVERLRLPSATECDVLGRLPNEVYGSDHLALAATFELKLTKSTL